MQTDTTAVYAAVKDDLPAQVRGCSLIEPNQAPLAVTNRDLCTSALALLYVPKKETHVPPTTVMHQSQRRVVCDGVEPASQFGKAWFVGICVNGSLVFARIVLSFKGELARSMFAMWDKACGYGLLVFCTDYSMQMQVRVCPSCSEIWAQIPAAVIQVVAHTICDLASMTESIIATLGLIECVREQRLHQLSLNDSPIKGPNRAL